MRLPILIIFILSTLLTQNLFSQKEDFIWYTGRSSMGLGSVHFFQFNDTSYDVNNVVVTGSYTIREGSGKSVMADPDGNLLFYTDGFDIFNLEHRIMENGDRTNVIQGQAEISYDLSGGLNVPDRTIILPSPANHGEYYVIYLGLKDDEIYPIHIIGSGLNYSMVDLSLNEGLGAVTEKNINLLEKRFQFGGLKAIRHANGRDWWLPVRDFLGTSWYMFLLDDKGIQLSHISDETEIPSYVCWLVLYDYANDQYICMTGDHFYPWQFFHDRPFEYQFHVYDFDRCEGSFSYTRTFELETWSIKYSLKQLTLCPNGRFLYGSLGGPYLIQYDTWAEDVQATADTLLNAYTMYNAVGEMYEPRLTPRGEMWLLHWAKDSITVLLNPEIAGADFNISDEFIVTNELNVGTFPNNANYRIGPIDGSPCDTLGIDNLPKAWFRYNGMNLTHLERRFTDASYFRPESWEWDFGDGSTFIGREPGVHEFPDPGDYYVCLTVSNENAEDTYCEWVTIEGPSNLREQLEERGFVLYPNPNRGKFQVRFSNSLTEGGDLQVFNTMGQQVHAQELSSGIQHIELELDHFPAGQYIVQIQTGTEVLSQSVVVMK